MMHTVQTDINRTDSQTIDRHPKDSVRAPAMAGPIAPPVKGANIMSDIAVPRCSLMKMSPTMAGLRTFAATATPVRALAAMNTFVLCDTAAMTVMPTKSTLATFRTRYLPNISLRGPINRGPVASPSSHIVTSSTDADLSAS